jgi:uncharacterized membrane-anchored protein
MDPSPAPSSGRDQSVTAFETAFRGPGRLCSAVKRGISTDSNWETSYKSKTKYCFPEVVERANGLDPSQRRRNGLSLPTTDRSQFAQAAADFLLAVAQQLIALLELALASSSLPLS